MCWMPLERSIKGNTTTTPSLKSFLREKTLPSCMPGQLRKLLQHPKRNLLPQKDNGLNTSRVLITCRLSDLCKAMVQAGVLQENLQHKYSLEGGTFMFITQMIAMENQQCLEQQFVWKDKKLLK